MHHCRPIVRGDFADFDISNEDDELEEFLGLPRHHSKPEPVHTGAVAGEVGRLQPGKINRGDQKVTILCRHTRHYLPGVAKQLLNFGCI